MTGFNAFRILEEINISTNYQLVDEQIHNNFHLFTVVETDNMEDNYYLIFVRSEYLDGRRAFDISVTYKVVDNGIDITFSGTEEGELENLKEVGIPVKMAIELCSDISDNDKIVDQIKNHYISETAQLYADSLVYLTVYEFEGISNIINSKILDFVPVEDNADSMIHSFYVACKRVMSNESMLYTNSQKFIRAKNTVITDNIRITELLHNKLILRLLKINIYDMIDTNLLTDSNENKFSYLQNIGVNVVSSQAIVKGITDTFMSCLTKDELCKLFTFFINDAKELWQIGDDEIASNSKHFLLYAPIAKLNNGKWTSAYTTDNKHNVYFPLSNMGDTVMSMDRDFCEIPVIREFFTLIGVESRDMGTFIKDVLLKRYEVNKKYPYYAVEAENNLSMIDDDFEIIISYYLNLKEEDRMDFISLINSRYKLQTYCGSSLYDISETMLAPQNISNDVLISKCWKFVDLNCYQKAIYEYGLEKVRDFLTAIGVKLEIEVKKRHTQSSNGYYQRNDYVTKFQTNALDHRYATHTQIDEDFLIDGFMKYISNIGYTDDGKTGHKTNLTYKSLNKGYFPISLSQFIWDGLGKLDKKNLEKYKETRYSWQYYEWHYLYTNSTFYESIRYTKWLLGNKLPSVITIEDLLEVGYTDYNLLFEYLQIKSRKQVEEERNKKIEKLKEQFGAAAEELGLSLADLIK